MTFAARLVQDRSTACIQDRDVSDAAAFKDHEPEAYRSLQLVLSAIDRIIVGSRAHGMSSLSQVRSLLHRPEATGWYPSDIRKRASAVVSGHLGLGADPKPADHLSVCG